MKRIIIIAGSVLSLLIISGFIIIYFWIASGIKENISIAQKQYPGNPEDALPVLHSLYLNDPEGKTCYHKHNSVLCQYEIYKAIRKIETGRLFTYDRMNK